MRASLEEALFAHQIDFVKTNDALQLALENKDALNIRVEKLLVDHTKLVEEHEFLVISSKVVKGDLIALTESYAQLKATIIKALTSVPHMDINNDACMANFVHDCTSLQEENKKLKALLVVFNWLEILLFTFRLCGCETLALSLNRAIISLCLLGLTCFAHHTLS